MASRYAIVGTGSRHKMYRDAIQNGYGNEAVLVALCDSNAGRLALSVDTAREHGGHEVPGFAAEEFGALLAEIQPEVVVVTSMDSTHDEALSRLCRASAMPVLPGHHRARLAEGDLLRPGAPRRLPPRWLRLRRRHRHRRHDERSCRLPKRRDTTYSLIAYAPWEGTFSGTKCRKHDVRESSYASGDGSIPGATVGNPGAMPAATACRPPRRYLGGGCRHRGERLHYRGEIRRSA